MYNNVIMLNYVTFINEDKHVSLFVFCLQKLNLRVEDPLPLVLPKFILAPTILLFPPKFFWYNPKLNNFGIIHYTNK
jgi:hypothetical protein